MDALNVDLTMIAAIWMGGCVLLVPLAGLTARFAFKPLLESVARIRAAGRETDPGVEARLEALEQRLSDLVRAVEDAAERNREQRAA
ncbi:MAG TPA: hypothetical protein VHG28_05165 [Longimicrobiaceae bacterium]|nr:hypothetical protein [Longimicrobiaceae bacterium]